MKFVLILLGFVVTMVCSCGPNQRILNSASESQVDRSAASNTNVVSAGPTFEDDLNAMRTADFRFILVFRRKDGQSMDAEDKTLIGKNTGLQANRRRLSDDGKAVIIGSNFPFETERINELTARYRMENYSKPDSGQMFSNSTPAGTK